MLTQPDNAIVYTNSAARQLRSFAVAGVGGFVVDALSLLALIHLGAGPYVGRAGSYLMAATATWLYNRTFTFKPDGRRGLFEEWLFYVTSQLSGAVLNLGVYSVLITFVPLFAAHPVLGVAAGSIAGLTANFMVARHIVFRVRPAGIAQDGLASANVDTGAPIEMSSIAKSWMIAIRRGRLTQLLTRSLVLVSLALLAIWPSLYNTQPFFFPDTTAYIRGADAAIAKATGFTSRWTADAADPQTVEGGAAVPSEDMAASPDATATKPPTVLAGRSAYYGAILYLGDALGEFWPTVLFQAAIFLLSVGLSLVNLRVFSWARFLGVTAFLALCTPVAFFNSFLMPDVFAGFCVLAAANLLAFEQRMGVAQRVYWFIVLALGMLFHSSHLLIAGGILAAWGAWAIWNRRSVNFVGAGIIGLALVTGAAGEQAFNIAVTKLAGNAPIRPPFLMARVIADGPGTAYLRANCPGAKFVICRYVDRLPPQSSDVFLWADDPKLGVFMAEDEATKRALSAEQFRFAAATIAYDPAGYARKSLDNIWEQLSTFRLDEFNYTDADLARFAVKVPEPYRSRIAETPAARAKMPVGGFDALAYTVVALSIALLIYSVIRRRPAYVSRRIFVFSAVIIVGLLLNGVICALMSMPHARYEARVIWLVPALVLMLELRAGERLWALPQLIARIRRS